MPKAFNKAFSRCNKNTRERVKPLVTRILALGLMTYGVMAYAQSAKLNIILKDQQTQRPLTQAIVTIVDREGKKQTSKTDIQGQAALGALQEGLYEVIVKQEGYQTLRLPSVRLIENKSTPVALTMSKLRENIEEVLIVGNSVGNSGSGSVSTSYITREALRSGAGSGGDVLRALDGLPGLFSDGEFSGFTVRGNGPRDNLILVDGIPFANVVHFSDSFGELDEVEGGGRYSVFAPNIIGNAEFQPGGWNAAYGGKAGSLLKLDVAEGNPETASYTARLDLAGLEIGYDGPSRIHDNTTVLFSARQLDFGRVFDTIGIDDIGDPKLTDVILKTRTDTQNGDTIKFLAIYAPESFSRDITHVLASDEDDPGNYEDLELIESESDNTLMALTWTRLIGHSGEITQQLYHRNFSESATAGEAQPYDDQGVDLSNTLAISAIPARFPITQSRRDETEIGLRLDYGQDNALGRFTSGLRLTQLDLDFALTLDDNWIRYEYNQNDFRPDTNQKYIEFTPEQVNTRYQAKDLTYSLYSDQLIEGDAWDIRLGLRFDADQITDDRALSPRLSGSYRLSKTLHFTAIAGRYLQSPFLGDVARDPSNANLAFEKNDQLSIGLKYSINTNLHLLIEPYYQRLTDLVVEQDGVNQTFNNAGEGRALGVDTALVRRFNGGWSASATYSYNDTQLKDSPSGEKYEADFSRPHAFTLGGIWEINERWKISGRMKWASGRLFDDSIIHENVLGDGQPLRFSKEFTTQNIDRYDSFSSINVRMDYRRSFGRVNMISFIDVINLLGSDNPSSVEFNERTGLNAVEEGESFPLFGIRFEW